VDEFHSGASAAFVYQFNPGCKGEQLCAGIQLPGVGCCCGVEIILNPSHASGKPDFLQSGLIILHIAAAPDIANSDDA
jgi:hypothetical protein